LRRLPDRRCPDVAGFALAAGIVTSIAARNSHAALVARQMGKPCVVGCRELKIDPAAKRAQLGNATLAEGEWMTIEGDAGELYLGRCETIRTRPEAELAEIAAWQAQSRQHDRHAAAS
jgi:pyruvate,orthophosphate dikinase